MSRPRKPARGWDTRWTSEEDTKLTRLAHKLPTGRPGPASRGATSNTWADIAAHFPGRSGRAVENRHRHLREAATPKAAAKAAAKAAKAAAKAAEAAAKVPHRSGIRMKKKRKMDEIEKIEKFLSREC